jgi:hypothetical protein
MFTTKWTGSEPYESTVSPLLHAGLGWRRRVTGPFTVCRGPPAGTAPWPALGDRNE